jgi:hypothetical protein
MPLFLQIAENRQYIRIESACIGESPASGTDQLIKPKPEEQMPNIKKLPPIPPKRARYSAASSAY